jgi:hypothetical protein
VSRKYAKAIQEYNVDERVLVGKDIGLLSLIHDYLSENNLPTSVLTGRTAF